MDKGFEIGILKELLEDSLWYLEKRGCREALVSGNETNEIAFIAKGYEMRVEIKITTEYKASIGKGKIKLNIKEALEKLKNLDKWIINLKEGGNIE